MAHPRSTGPTALTHSGWTSWAGCPTSRMTTSTRCFATSSRQERAKMTDKPIDVASLSAEEKRVLLARLLMEKAEASASAYPLSYGQRSLWFLYQLAPGSPAYTITYAGQIRGELSVTALEAAAQALVDRHDILRTTYSTRDGQPVQLVPPRLPVRVNRLELDPEEAQRWLRRESDRPFDLRTGPVVRFNLITQGPDEHL